MALSLPQAGELKLRDNGTAHRHFVRSQNGHFSILRQSCRRYAPDDVSNVIGDK
jgi:hypothetical protein